MKKILLLLQVIIVMSFVNQKRNKVIFFGDSITQAGVNPGGYIMRIDSMCKAESKADSYEFIGAGIGGNKVYDLFLRMEADVLSKNPDLVVIYIGVNDVCIKQVLVPEQMQISLKNFIWPSSIN